MPAPDPVNWKDVFENLLTLLALGVAGLGLIGVKVFLWHRKRR
jgi:hypothetical protein